MSDFDSPKYKNATAARRYLEGVRWPDGPVCPHCGVVNNSSAIKGGRDGLYFCNDCRKQFTVTVGTVFERSKIPLHKWLLGFRLMASSKKGISAHQLHRTLGVTYKTAWFMAHRIREAMDEKPGSGPLGGEGKIVEADETFLGSSGYEFANNDGWRMKRGLGDKMKVVTLVERGGRARSIKVENLSKATIRGFLVKHGDRKSTLMTDEATHYIAPGKEFKRHYTVNHAKGEYAFDIATTNTVEGYFSIFKRGMRGIYQHCNEKHLQRYLNEFDFRYSNRHVDDAERTEIAVKGAEGKRLTYHQSRKAARA